MTMTTTASPAAAESESEIMCLFRQWNVLDRVPSIDDALDAALVDAKSVIEGRLLQIPPVDARDLAVKALIRTWNGINMDNGDTLEEMRAIVGVGEPTPLATMPAACRGARR